jgi:hypothetical protein
LLLDCNQSCSSDPAATAPLPSSSMAVPAAAGLAAAAAARAAARLRAPLQATKASRPHLAWLLCQAAHQSVAVAPSRGAIVVVLHDDCLLAGILARQKDHHLPGLQKKQMVSAQGSAARCCRLEKSSTAAVASPSGTSPFLSAAEFDLTTVCCKEGELQGCRGFLVQVGYRVGLSFKGFKRELSLR